MGTLGTDALGETTISCTLGTGGGAAACSRGVLAIGGEGGDGSFDSLCNGGDKSVGGIVGGRDGAGYGKGYIVFRIEAILRTPCIVGSPIFMPGGGAVE